jgi:thiamine biosynthesis lipoprotein
MLLRFIALCVPLLLFGCAASTGHERYDFSRHQMGARISVAVYSDSEERARAGAAAAFGEIARLERIMSDYRADSELSRLCRRFADETVRPPVQVSDDLYEVLRRANQISEATQGAFDVTVGPAVALWRRARRDARLPRPDQLADATRRVSWRSVTIDENTGGVTLATGASLDLGGIAKGYAADRALAILRERGLSAALVNAGGDLAAGDPPPGRDGWRLRIDDGVEGDDDAPILVSNVGVATSGDLYQFVEIDGVRYSHIVDPRTGLGLTTRRTVTVLAPDATLADALASALTVLGPEHAPRVVARHPGVSARIVQIEGERPVTTTFGDFPEGR